MFYKFRDRKPQPAPATRAPRPRAGRGGLRGRRDPRRASQRTRGVRAGRPVRHRVDARATTRACTRTSPAPRAVRTSVSEFAQRLPGSAHHRDRRRSERIGGATRGGPRRRGDGAGPRPHAPVRRAVARLQLQDRRGSRRAGTRILWSRSLTFPGLRPGELLSRRTIAAAARDAAGSRRQRARRKRRPAAAPARSRAEATRNSPLGDVADAVARDRRARSGRTPPGARRTGRPGRSDRRAERPRARARRPPAGHPGRRAARRSAPARLRHAAPRCAGSHDRLPGAAAARR